MFFYQVSITKTSQTMSNQYLQQKITHPTNNALRGKHFFKKPSQQINNKI